jgi:DNA-binding transcriptional ArsR family regulator
MKQSGTVKSTLGDIAAHPTRAKCLAILTERPASPAELARELGQELGVVAYHVKRLRDLEAVELVEERPVRGAMEHFYRAIKRPFIDDEEYLDVSLEDRLKFARAILQLSVVDATTAIETGSLAERHNHHISRFPSQVDEKGWEDMMELLQETLARAMEIEAESVARGGTTIPIRVILQGFEMPTD